MRIKLIRNIESRLIEDTLPSDGATQKVFSDLVDAITDLLFQLPASDGMVTVFQDLRALMGLCKKLNTAILPIAMLTDIAQCIHILVLLVFSYSAQERRDLLGDSPTQRGLRAEYKEILKVIQSSVSKESAHQLFHTHIQYAIEGMHAMEFHRSSDPISFNAFFEGLEALLSDLSNMSIVSLLPSLVQKAANMIATNWIPRDFYTIFILLRLPSVIETKKDAEVNDALQTLLDYQKDTSSQNVFGIRLFLLDAIIKRYSKEKKLRWCELAQTGFQYYVDGLHSRLHLTFSFQWFRLGGRENCRIILIDMLKKRSEDFDSTAISEMLKKLDPSWKAEESKSDEAAVGDSWIEKLETLHTLINALPPVSVAEKKQAILVIGNTGAGKSATVEMLMKPVGEEGAPTHRPRIGPDLDRSTTIFPDIYPDGENTERYYIDCPGFEHTDATQKAAVSLLMESLVTQHDIKAILIIINAQSFFADRGLSLLALFKTLRTFLKINLETSKKEDCIFIFGLTHLWPVPNKGKLRGIHTIDDFGETLKQLGEGFAQELNAKMQRLQKKVVTRGEKKEITYGEEELNLLSNKLSIEMLQRAMVLGRVVLVDESESGKVAARSTLRQQLDALPSDIRLNSIFNFENYDPDRKRFMDTLLEKATNWLTVLEGEAALMDQYHYLLESGSAEENNKRIASLRTEITEKEAELARIDRRETAVEAYWSREEHQSKQVTYDKEEPIAKVVLSVDEGLQAWPMVMAVLESLLEKWSRFLTDPDPSGRGLVGGLFGTIIVIASALAAGIISTPFEIYGIAREKRHPTRFVSLQVGEQRVETIDSKYWEQSIVLPEKIEALHSHFSVQFEKPSHFSQIQGKVEIYVPICYMPGHPERIGSLKEVLAVLKKVELFEQEELQQHNRKIEDIAERNKIEAEMLAEKSVLLRYALAELKPYVETIEQHRKLITCIYEIFTKLHISLHANISNLIQLWNKRTARILAIQCSEKEGEHAFTAFISSFETATPVAAAASDTFAGAASAGLFGRSTKSSSASETRTAEYEGVQYTLEAHETRGDGNCGYYALPIAHDREGVKQLLLARRTDPEILHLVAPEIADAIRSPDAPSVISKYPAVQTWRREQARLDETSAPQSAMDAHLIRLKNLAENTQLFELFVNHDVQGRGRLGFYADGAHRTTGILDALAKIANIKICIWRFGDGETAELFSVINPEGSTAHHLRHHVGVDTHFELVSLVPIVPAPAGGVHPGK